LTGIIAQNFIDKILKCRYQRILFSEIILNFQASLKSYPFLKLYKQLKGWFSDSIVKNRFSDGAVKNSRSSLARFTAPSSLPNIMFAGDYYGKRDDWIRTGCGRRNIGHANRPGSG
jgi:hypothetical protein